MSEINNYLKELQKDIVISVDAAKINYFNSIIDELCNIAEKYNNNFYLMNEQYAVLTADIRYASGSKGLHRGYYCPSPILDLVVGGCKRGRIIKKPTKVSHEYYQYCFNSSKQLIYINQFIEPTNNSPYSTEFIIRQNNIEYGITYHNGHKDISYLSRCEYENNKIINYATLCYFNGISNDMMSLQFEEYEYKNNILWKAVMYPGIVPKYNLYSNTKFEFIYDNNCTIVEYIAKSDYQGQKIMNRYKT